MTGPLSILAPTRARFHVVLGRRSRRGPWSSGAPNRYADAVEPLISLHPGSLRMMVLSRSIVLVLTAHAALSQFALVVPTDFVGAIESPRFGRLSRRRTREGNGFRFP